MLQIKQLQAGYGVTRVLNDVDLHVGAGEIVALIGANGAGKSTLLNTCMGLVRATSGSIVFNRRNITSVPTYKIVRSGMALVPEGRRIFKDLSVEKNLLVATYGANNADGRSERLESVYALFPRLRERMRQLAGTMSGGEQQMLALGRAMMSNPKLLLLDEPSLGLSPLLQEQLFTAISEISSRGITILVVEQNAYLALEVSHRTYIMKHGCIVKEGRSSVISEDKLVQEAYLGS